MIIGEHPVCSLHGLTVDYSVMPPGAIRAGEDGFALRCGVGPTPFGPATIVWSARGVCELAFIDAEGMLGSGEDGLSSTGDDASWRERIREQGADPLVADVLGRWPGATVMRDDDGAGSWLATIFPSTPVPGRLQLCLRGTPFQVQVWQSLLRIAPGETISYGALAARMGSPRAARAVGSAVAANTIAYLIPCHRVIRASGDTGQYRWGSARKQAMLAWEVVRREPKVD